MRNNDTGSMGSFYATLDKNR